jgi:hypothetical protein
MIILYYTQNNISGKYYYIVFTPILAIICDEFYMNKHKLQDLLLNISDDDNDEIETQTDNDFFNTKPDTPEEESLFLICNNEIDSDNPKISAFLKFCISKGLFDNTFYDTHNMFSVMATKLPNTFELLSDDGEDVPKPTFVKFFRKDVGFKGDINFIYNCLDSKKKGFVTWDEFLNFFLPFIKYITV